MTYPLLSSPLAFIVSAMALWAVSAFAAVLWARKSTHRLFSASLLIGSLLLLGGAITGFHGDLLWTAPPPIYFAVAPMLNRLDMLSAFFLGLLGIGGIANALFSPGFLDRLGDRITPRVYWSCLFLCVLSMAEVILSANALTFLVFWELMSLSSAALVATKHSNHVVQRAAVIYLGSTRIATAFLSGGFLWMHHLSGSWNFADWQMSGPAYLVPAVLIFLGLAIKAGVWPFHNWLPYAYPVAPSTVVSLMSGVMSKIAIATMIRLLVFTHVSVPGFPYVVLFLGTVSAFWGGLFAIQTIDLKRILAYSSIENIGLILMGIGGCLYCKSINEPLAAAIALSAAILHCANHSFAKTLLFLGAGSIGAAVGSRDLGHLGGLTKNMPWTTSCFLLGSSAICALPPLNGFVSKWLLYQSLFGLSWGSNSVLNRAAGLACIGVLAMVGGLAVAAFTRANGIALLGRARSGAAKNAKEASPGMIAAQVFLCICCVAAGMFPQDALRVAEPIVQQFIKPPVPMSSVFTIPESGLLLCLFATFFFLYSLLLRGRYARIRLYRSWECGFGDLSSRSEATGPSFAQPIESIFRSLLQFKYELKLEGKDRRHFPEQIRVESSTKSWLEEKIYMPMINGIRWLGQRFATIQAGSIHLYLLYMLITLILLVTVGTNL